MSSFTDMMIDDGFSDRQEYMDYLERKAIRDYNYSAFSHNDSDEEYEDFEDDDFLDGYHDMIE